MIVECLLVVRAFAGIQCSQLEIGCDQFSMGALNQRRRSREVIWPSRCLPTRKVSLLLFDRLVDELVHAV